MHLPEVRLPSVGSVLATCLLVGLLAEGVAIAAPSPSPDASGGRAASSEALTTGQQPPTTGSVAGVLLEFDGTPLLGVAIRIEGAEGDPMVRTVVTDRQARFEFVGLQPGTYRFSVELPGAIVSGDTVTVRAGIQVSTTLVLDLFATDVQVTVQAEAPEPSDPDLSDPDSTSRVRTVPILTLDRLPLPAEQALEVLRLLPGVVRGPKGQVSVEGTLPSDSMLLFNGIDLMDPFSGQFRLRLPLDAVEDVKLYSGVYPASHGQLLGGLVDVTTVAGGEEWDFKISSFFPKPRFNDGTIMGIKNASPRVRFGGPLREGKLYLSQSAEYHFDRIDVEDVPGNPPQDHIKVEGWESLSQLDWRPSERHNFHLSLLAFPQMDEFVGLDGLTPPEATSNFERDAEAVLGKHDWQINERSSFEASVQYNRIGIASSPQGQEPLEVIPEGFQGNAFHREDRQTSHMEGLAIYSYRFGEADRSSHLLQVGGELHRMEIRGTFENDTILVRGADGRLLQRIDFVGRSLYEQDKHEWGAFVQDRWTHSYRFWCDVGLRYSSDSINEDHRLGPRIGLAWDPLGDRRTLIKAGAGLLYRRVYLGENLWEQMPIRVETTFSDDGSGGGVVRAFVPRIEDKLSAPWSVLTTVDVSRRISSGLIVRAKFSRREAGDQIIVDRVEPAGFLLFPGDDPVSALLGRPEGPEGALLLSESGSSTSWQVELTGAYRLARGGEFIFSYVRSSAVGDLNDFNIVTGEIPEAIIRPNRRADLPFDAPHRLLVWGTADLPWGLVVAPVLEWRSGFPYSLLNEDQSYVGEANTERFPSFLSVDAQVTKEITLGKYTIVGGVKLTNITGHDNPRQVIANVASPRFGEFRNDVPFKLRAKFSLKF